MTSHSNCDHEATKAARAACRKARGGAPTSTRPTRRSRASRLTVTIDPEMRGATFDADPARTLPYQPPILKGRILR